MKSLIVAAILLFSYPVFASQAARDTLNPKTTVEWIQWYANHLNAGLDSLQGNFQTQIDNLKTRVDSLDQRVGSLEDLFSLITEPLVLRWSGGDPESDKVYYFVHFGTDSVNLPQIGVTTDTFYTPGKLNMATWYYWRIIADDSLYTNGLKFPTGGATRHPLIYGPVWRFKTVDPGNYLNKRR